MGEQYQHKRKLYLLNIEIVAMAEVVRYGMEKRTGGTHKGRTLKKINAWHKDKAGA